MSTTDNLHEEDFFQSTDGLRLFEQRWRPPSSPRATVIIIHGLVDNSSYYGGAASELVKHGYAVYGFDLRGHGSSEGHQSFVRSFDDYLSDVEVFTKRVQDSESGPFFLFGHSMGGAIATLFIMTKKPNLQGLLLSGAALKVGTDVSALTRRLTPGLSRLFPGLRALNLDINFVSRNPDVIQSKTKDPLIDHKKIPVRTGAELLRAIGNIQAQMEDVTLPLLIMHGTEDRWTNPEGSKELYARAHSSDKTLKMYQGFYHELLSDPDRATVLADMIEWLDARYRTQ